MSTGAEHYREAERLLTQAEQYVSSDWPLETGESKADILAAAQVHATLALASKQDAKPETAQVTRALVYRQWTGDWNLTTNWAGTRYITVDYPNGNRVTAAVTIDDVEVTRAGHH